MSKEDNIIKLYIKLGSGDSFNDVICLKCPRLPDHKSSKYKKIIFDCINRQYHDSVCIGGHLKVIKNPITAKKVIHKSECYDNIEYDHIKHFFLSNRYLHPNLAEILTDLIGYIPFLKNIRKGEITSDRIKASELLYDVIPIAFMTFAGIEIPKAFYDMSDYIKNRDGVAIDSQDHKIEDFEDYLRPLIPMALEKLRKIGNVWCDFEDVVVYDYLGLDIMGKGFMLIGEQALLCNALELARRGYMGRNNMVWFHVDKTEREERIRSSPLCTPAILKIYGYQFFLINYII